MKCFRNAWMLGLGACVAAVSGCSDAGTGPGARPPVAVVEITPSVMTLTTGDSAQLSATVRAPNGVPLPDRIVMWSSSDSTVAAISESGLVRALRSGVASIQAATEGRAGFVAISVADPMDPAPRLSHLSPSSAVRGSGDVVLTVIGTNFASDAVVLWNGAPRATVRASADELRATIRADDLSATGVFPVSVRHPTANATSAPLTFRVVERRLTAVVVSPDSATLSAGSRLRLTARAYDQNGMELPQQQFTWSTSSQATASVDTFGEVTAHAVGVALITVEAEGQSAKARIEVVPSVSYVVIDPATVAVLVDGHVQLRAIPISASGGLLTGRLVTWSSDDPQVATVSPTGLVTGIAKGTARVRATIEGKAGVATIEVRQFAPGVTQVFKLRGPWGTPIMPTVGTTTWVDEHGIAHEASLVLTGGTLTLRSDISRYEQILVLDVVVANRGTVGRSQWTDDGSFELGWLDGRYVFTSSTQTTPMWGRIIGPGEFLVEQTIGSAPAFQYLWIVQ